MNIVTRLMTMPEPLVEFCGVRFPDWLPLFDCRSPEDVIELDPSGQVYVFGGERAEYALGLRSFENGIYDGTEPISISGFGDTRDEAGWAAKRLPEILRDLIETAEEMKKKYESLSTYAGPYEHGGSCYYLPRAVYLANYGAGLVCDRRNYRVDPFL